MIILNKIIKALEVLYNIPSIIILIFVLIYKSYKKYKQSGDVNELLQDKYYVKDAVEEFKPIGKHINNAFWILITYFIYF
jgi:hypothetical protein